MKRVKGGLLSASLKTCAMYNLLGDCDVYTMDKMIKINKYHIICKNDKSASMT